MTQTRPDPVARFFGAGLLAIGLLMMLLCGGCGAAFLLFFLVDGIRHPNGMPMAMIPVLVGGVPALVGFALFAVGRSLRRPSTRPPPSAPPPG